MLTVVTWHWGDKFGQKYVDRLRSGVARNLAQEHRFLVIKPQAEDQYLTKIAGCFARLRMFDPAWQAANDITDRVVCIDLDTVITGPLDPLFDRPEPFVIMQGGNASNPCPFNGAMMMLRAGAHPEVWTDFSLKAAKKVPFDSFPDDQGWIWHKIPDAAGWTTGEETGVYVFRKPGWPGWSRLADITPGDTPPEGARLVTFSGWRSPEKFKDLAWVKENWR